MWNSCFGWIKLQINYLAWKLKSIRTIVEEFTRVRVHLPFSWIPKGKATNTLKYKTNYRIQCSIYQFRSSWITDITLKKLYGKPGGNWRLADEPSRSLYWALRKCRLYDLRTNKILTWRDCLIACTSPLPKYNLTKCKVFVLCHLKAVGTS